MFMWKCSQESCGSSLRKEEEVAIYLSKYNTSHPEPANKDFKRNLWGLERWLRG
jgi:hypothetical protein